MKIRTATIRNFRTFSDFTLDLDCRSVFVIGENAGGKTSLLTAIARALGRDPNFTSADFADINQPVVIEVTLSGFDQAQRGLFNQYIHFDNPQTLTVGVRAIWDAAAEEAEVEHYYPRHPGSRSKREEREGIPLQWLPSWRDPARMLQFGVQRNLIGLLLEALPLGQSLDQAVDDVRQASEQLGRDGALVALFQQARDRLAELLPDVRQNAFAMGASALTGRDLLRQFELQVEHLGEPISISRQSSGVAQLAIFVFAMQLAAAETGTLLLVDEPEISLHPQSQRALMRSLRSLDGQTIVATHSSNLLDRADPRTVLRLKRVATGVKVVSPSTLTDDVARRLARHTSPQTAEAFFARAVILVEGPADQYALEALAQRRGRNLDAEGISIVPIGGANTIGTYLQLFGPSGFDIPLAGLCDQDKEPVFSKALEAAGLGQNLNRQAMEQIGFFVCDLDLEDVLIRAVGAQNTEQLIDQRGDLADLRRLQQQPEYQNAPLDEQVKAFVGKRKIEYAPVLVDGLDLGHVPHPLDEVLARV